MTLIRLCLVPGQMPSGLEGAEGDDRKRVLDAGENLHLLVDEMADVFLVIDIEFGEQVVIAGSRIDLRGDLGIGKRAGNLIGFAELAFDLHEKRLHGFVPLNVQVQAALLADWRRPFKHWNPHLAGAAPGHGLAHLRNRHDIPVANIRNR